MNQWPVVSGQWSVRHRKAAGISHSQFRIPHSGFTLVELLVVITILSILASMVLFALASSAEAARVAKTKTTINKLHALIMAKYESYKTRRVPVDVKAVATQRMYTNGPTGWARARLDVIRELMRMEMPDGFTDIDDDPITKWAS